MLPNDIICYSYTLRLYLPALISCRYRSSNLAIRRRQQNVLLSKKALLKLSISEERKSFYRRRQSPLKLFRYSFCFQQCRTIAKLSWTQWFATKSSFYWEFRKNPAGRSTKLQSDHMTTIIRFHLIRHCEYDLIIMQCDIELCIYILTKSH